MTNRKMLAAIACAVATFIGTGAAGYEAGVEAVIPGTGISIQAEWARILFTIAAAFLPAMADKWFPGLGKVIKRILDGLLDSQTKRESANIQESAESIDALDDLIGGTKEGRVLMEKVLCLVYKCKHEGADESE